VECLDEIEVVGTRQGLLDEIVVPSRRGIRDEIDISPLVGVKSSEDIIDGSFPYQLPLSSELTVGKLRDALAKFGFARCKRF